MFKKIINRTLICAALCSATAAFAQQDPVFTNYLAAPNVFNPAYAGSHDALNVTALSRIQWVDFDGAPRTNFISAHSPIQDKNIGVGFSFINDKLGPEKYNHFYADFSYSLPISATQTIRFGLKGGGTLYSNDLSSLTLQRSDDPSFARSISGEFLPNIGFGAFWQAERFFAGISVPKLLKSTVSFDNGGEVARIGTSERHFYLFGGASLEVSPEITLKPSTLIRMVGSSPLSLDVNVNAVFYEKMWFGLSYRLEDAIGAMAAFQANEQLRVGYSYDYPTFGMDVANHLGSHEIMLTYDFVFTKGKVTSPRYF